jgi:hypothetical protein
VGDKGVEFILNQGGYLSATNQDFFLFRSHEVKTIATLCRFI